MSKKRLYLLAAIGSIFFIIGAYFFSINNEVSGTAYSYLGLGTFAATILYYSLFPRYREVVSFFIGLTVLHLGVILILVNEIKNPRLIGLAVFTAGIVTLLNSGFSEWLKKKRGGRKNNR